MGHAKPPSFQPTRVERRQIRALARATAKLQAEDSDPSAFAARLRELDDQNSTAKFTVSMRDARREHAFIGKLLREELARHAKMHKDSDAVCKPVAGKCSATSRGVRAHAKYVKGLAELQKDELAAVQLTEAGSELRTLGGLLTAMKRHWGVSEYESLMLAYEAELPLSEDILDTETQRFIDRRKEHDRKYGIKRKRTKT